MKNSYPLASAAVLAFLAVVMFAVLITIGFYVRDTNRLSNIENREVRQHRIANERSHNVLCINQQRLAQELGIEGGLECPEPTTFDESGLGH